jgi:hypothetical protein
MASSVVGGTPFEFEVCVLVGTGSFRRVGSGISEAGRGGDDGGTDEVRSAGCCVSSSRDAIIVSVLLRLLVSLVVEMLAG